MQYEAPNFAKITASFSPLEYGDTGTTNMRTLIAKRSHISSNPQRVEQTVMQVSSSIIYLVPGVATTVWYVFKVKQWAVGWTHTMTDHYNPAGIKGPDSPDVLPSSTGYNRYFVGASKSAAPEGITLVSRWDDVPLRFGGAWNFIDQLEMGYWFTESDAVAYANSANGL